MANICFVFPYKYGGGVPHLFARCAIILSKNKKNNISVVDYSDGSLASLVKNSDVNLIEYSDKKVCKIPCDTTAVLQLMTPWSIFKKFEMESSSKVIFWACHPFNIVPLLPGIRNTMASSPRLSKFLLYTILRSYWKSSKLFLKSLAKKQAIIFVDGPTFCNPIRYLGKLDILPIFVPIGIKDYMHKDKIYSSQRTEYPLRFVWVGRIVDFKFFPLKKILKELF